MMETHADKSTQTISETTTGTPSGPTVATVLSSSIYGTPRTTATTSASGSLSNVPAKPSDSHGTVGATASTSRFPKNVILLPTKRAPSPTSLSSSKKMKVSDVSSTSDGNKENVYKFKVQLKYEKKTYRIILLKGASSLHELAEAITSAFDFDMDHAFAFYNNVNQFASTASYTSFADRGMKLEPEEKSVAHTYIYQVFKRRDKWLFFYDFGDSWEFLVDCQDENVKAKPGAEYPQVIKKNGDAPPQYVYPSDEDYSSDD